MNHRRSAAAVLLAVAALAACGEADPDADPLPTPAISRSAAQANAAWWDYYEQTHPAPVARRQTQIMKTERQVRLEAKLAEAEMADARRAAESTASLSADAAEHRFDFEATTTRAASSGSLSADASEHRAAVEVTVEQHSASRTMNRVD